MVGIVGIEVLIVRKCLVIGGLMSILARNITKKFGSFTALDDVTVEAPSGKLVALLGPSGSGKTTLVSVIAGILTQTEGECLISNLDLNHMPDKEKTLYRGTGKAPTNWKVQAQSWFLLHKNSS